MRRFYALISFFIISSLACGLFTTATPKPSTTNVAIATSHTQAPSSTSTQPLTAITTAPDGGTQAPVGAATATPNREEPTKTPYPTSALDSTLSGEINLIQTQVVDERQLQPKFPVPVVLLSPEQLRQNVVSDYESDYSDEDAADDVYELSITGLLQPGFDMRNFMIELLSEQIAGFYDPEMREMFVVEAQGFEGPERMTYSHEYTHVLQDQNYDLEHGLNLNDDACEADSERCGAIQALVEGDATLSEITWFQSYATLQDQRQYIDYVNSLKTPIYDSAPAFLKDDFIFPYNQGLTFVQTIHDQGGWAAVNAVYQNPPVSTEQILHPSLYPADVPIPVDLPDLASTLGDGWREVKRNQMGEWYTYLILARGADTNAQLDDNIAQSAAAGWGGDEYLVLHDDAKNLTAFVMKTVWDAPGEASEFTSAFQDYANARFGVKAALQADTYTWTYGDGFSSLKSSGDTTIWIIAPDAATAQTISGAVQP